MSEGGWREYRADDRVWAGRMTGQHGPVLRFMRHDAQREFQGEREKEDGELKSYVRLSSSHFSSDELQSGRLCGALTHTL